MNPFDMPMINMPMKTQYCEACEQVARKGDHYNYKYKHTCGKYASLQSEEIHREGVKHDQGKLRYDLIDPYAQAEFVKVLTYGADKYGARNWELGISKDRLIAAAFRHIEAYRRDIKLDSDTNLNHLAHAICTLHFLLAFDKNPNLPRKNNVESKVPSYSNQESSDVPKREEAFSSIDSKRQNFCILCQFTVPCGTLCDQCNEKLRVNPKQVIDTLIRSS